MVDTISASPRLEYEHDAWVIDVSVGGSQKGLMLPPGLGFKRGVGKGACGGEGQSLDALLLGIGREVIAYNKVGHLAPTRGGQPALWD